MKSLSRVQLYTTPWTAAHQAPPSMGFSRQQRTQIMGFPCSSAGKESTCIAGDPGSTPGWLGSTGEEGIGYLLQYSWASLVAQLVKNPPAMRETWVRSLFGKIPWRRERLPTPVFWPGEFHGLYIHGVAKSQTRLSDFHFQRQRK